MNQEQLNRELLVAAMDGDTKSVEDWVARGANVNCKGSSGWSPLHRAAWHGQTETMSRLVELGGDINVKDEDGQSPLHLAAAGGHTETVSRLVELGGDINAKDNKLGDSPLYLAAEEGHTETVSMLVELGGDVNVKDYTGQTPYDISWKDDIKELLKSHMSRDEDTTRIPHTVKDQFQKREHSVMLNRLLGQGSYESYDMRIMVTGQFGVGKTSLVLILVGDALPNDRRATDGIFLMEGRCGLGIEGKDWIVIKKEDYDALDVVYNKVLTSSLESDTKVKQTTTMQKQLSPNMSSETRPAINVTTSEGKLKHTEEMPRRNIMSKVTKDAIRKKMEAVLKSGKYKMKTGRIIFWDFGGQYVYYTTHQTFMTYRALFLVVFDGSKGLYEEVKDVMCFPGQQGTPTPAVFLQHWVNSILTYCKLMYPGIPKILFVATHKDKVDQSTFEKTRKSLYADVEKLFKDHHGRQHLILEHQLFVNATDKNDEGIKVLKKVITDLTFDHPCWGEPMPNAWIPLELEIAEISAEGKQILSYKDVEDLNNASNVSVLSKEDLKFFLEFQHSLGKIIYFDTPQLRDYVIIGPLFLIEVMKSFVTDEQFWPKDSKIIIFKKMSNEGVIKKSDLYIIWEQFEKIRPHKDFVLNMLVHLDILSEQRRYDLKTGSRQLVDEYFVPCMLTKQDRTKLMERYMKNECTPGRAISLAFVFKSPIIPPALPNRLISACLSMWAVKEYDEEKLLFPGFVALSWDKTHDIVLCVLVNTILVYIIHESEKGLIVRDIATGVRECLHTTLERIFEFYQSTSSMKRNDSELPFHVEFACSNLNCYLRKTVLDNGNQNCAEHNEEYNINIWYQGEDPEEECDSSCKGLTLTALQEIPSDMQLFRLSRKLDADLMLPLALNLGLTRVEFKDEKSNYPSDVAMFKFLVLIKWKRKKNGTFNDLHVALPKQEVGSNVHELCKVNRMIMKRKSTVIPEEDLNCIPTDEILDALAVAIASDYLYLGIELGLSVADVRTIEYDNKNNLWAINKCILQKWKTDTKVKPTLDVLERALVNVGRGSDCLKKIINDKVRVKQHRNEKPGPHKSGLSSSTSKAITREANPSHRAEQTEHTKPTMEGNPSHRTEHIKPTTIEGNPTQKN